MQLKLPYPISANRYWFMAKNRLIPTKEAKHYKHEVSLLAKQQGCLKLSGDVVLNIIIAPKMNQDGSADKRLLDLDNCLKVLIDALQGVAYDNDKQIKRIVVCYADKPEINGAAFVVVEAFGAV